MEFVLKALEGIFSIVFIIGIGFVLSRRGWFDEYSSALIARLVTAVSLPLYMIVSISKILIIINWLPWRLICCCRSVPCCWLLVSVQ